MKHIDAEVTIADGNWHTLQAVNPPGGRNLVVKERTGSEALYIGLSSDGGATFGETYRTQPGIPFCIPGTLSGGVRVRVMRVSANTIYVQQTIEY